ncbi:MAG TPA: 50S ribosomal protein L15 [Candidatus Korarchaeota archaeon]|nr:50S ribosomal protein L15 [Candidatus Korarchaeota archaeon]
MPRREKKTKKYRGSRFHGYGKLRQHRGGGRRGGRGMAGLHKHKWTWTTAKAPDYFGRGRRGFKVPKTVSPKIINLGQIEDRLEEFLKLNFASKTEEGVVEVDLVKAGYDKVLGMGRLSFPITIKCKAFSETAVRKIEEVGGKVILVK